ncbi:MAG: NUDIX domain-containing protein [Paracoccus sp. (in: a-proteobacteria)]
MTIHEIILAGPLAMPELLDVFGLHGKQETLSGQLSGGADAGLGGDWPAWQAGAGRIAAMRVTDTPSLRRYLQIMALKPKSVYEHDVWGLGEGNGADWSADRVVLMAYVAQAVLARPADWDPGRIAARLPRIAEIAAGRLRVVAGSAPTALLPAPDPDRTEITARHERYGRYFSLEEITLRHRRFDGGWSAALDREVFISADAALLLPYDPMRDCVLLISQFRVGPLARGDKQCWMLEPIAGRIDAGETAADAARREAVEEAGLTVGGLYALPGHYPTPGANSEFFYPFVAVTDLSRHESRQGFGLEDEGEDISTHIISRKELVSLVMEGQLQCGPLNFMALWLDRNADQIRSELAGT